MDFEFKPVNADNPEVLPLEENPFLTWEQANPKHLMVQLPEGTELNQNPQNYIGEMAMPVIHTDLTPSGIANLFKIKY